MHDYSFKIPENLARVRLDKALTILSNLTRTRIQQLIKSSNVVVNNITTTDASKIIYQGDDITITVQDPVDTTIKPANIDLDIIYEDEHLLVINKQAGLTVHPSPGHYDDTLVNALLAVCGNSLSGIGGVLRPGIVHRLDRDTSGLMVVAKNDISHQSLAKQIETRNLKRVYNAIIWGIPVPHEGTIVTNIARHTHDRMRMNVVRSGGKISKTNYKVLEIFPHASFVECRLDTGRTHQIRVHMTHIGHSIVGDQTYGNNMRKISSHYKGEQAAALKEFGRQALHSSYIEFNHPVSNNLLNFYSPIPKDMEKIKDLLKQSS